MRQTICGLPLSSCTQCPWHQDKVDFRGISILHEPTKQVAVNRKVCGVIMRGQGPTAEELHCLGRSIALSYSIPVVTPADDSESYRRFPVWGTYSSSGGSAAWCLVSLGTWDEYSRSLRGARRSALRPSGSAVSFSLLGTLRYAGKTEYAPHGN